MINGVVSKIDMDNGNFPIAKDALRALSKTKISGAHQAIINTIWLETYGWHDEQSTHEQKVKKRKTSASIAYQVFEEETWMDKTVISRKIAELVEWGIIFRDKNTVPYTYSFNVNVSQWSKDIFRDTAFYRTVNSLQDDQQLTGLQDSQLFTEQSTESLLTTQLGVDYPVNSLQAETPNPQGVSVPLNNILNNSLNNIYIVVFEAWNQQKIIVHRELTDKMKKAIDKAVGQDGLEKVLLAMSRFGTMFHDPDCTWCKYAWGLDDFLERKKGYRYFLDDGGKWINYKQQKKDIYAQRARAPDRDKKSAQYGENADVL